MNPETVNLILQLAALATKIALDVRAQAGIADEELLRVAGEKNAETRVHIEAFLARVNAAAKETSNPPAS
jgi:hypothetical protein